MTSRLITHARRADKRTREESTQLGLLGWKRRRPGLRYVQRIERELIMARITIEKLEKRLAEVTR